MATAKKLPSGNYRVRAYDKTTGTTKSFTASTKKEAEFLANEWLTGRRAVPIEDKTVKNAIEDYIKLKRDILSVTTADKYNNICKNQLSEQFLSRKLSEIESLTVQTEINRLSGIYSPKTVHNASGLISAVMKTYFPDKRITVTLPKIQKRQRQLPTAEEIVEVFRGSGEMELIVLLGMWQGLRASEIRGLRKSDFREGELHVDRVIVTVDGEHIEKNIAKTVSSKRGVSVPEYIQAMVDALPTEHITDLSGSAIYKRFVRRMEKYGYKGVTFHDLRHINASVMLKLGIPDKYAMERGGWSTTSTLKRVYQETFRQDRIAADEKVDTYFSKILATKLATKENEPHNKADYGA